VNTCFVCKQELIEFQKLLINDQVPVCFDCFFKDIPEHPLPDDPQKEIKSKKREGAIQARANVLLNKFRAESPR